jgi:flagellar protein FlbD
MIFVTRLDGREVVVNVDLIITIEKIPDTVLTLTTGDRIMVRESVEEIVQRAIAYRHRLLQGPGARDGLADLAAALESRQTRADDDDTADHTDDALNPKQS